MQERQRKQQCCWKNRRRRLPEQHQQSRHRKRAGNYDERSFFIRVNLLHGFSNSKKFILEKLRAGSHGSLLKDADGAAVQQFAGHPDLLRQSHTRMLDQLDQLIRCQPAKGFCVLLVGHQRGFDYPGEIDAIVSHHRDVLRDAQPRFGQGVVAAQCGKVIREDDAGGPLRQCQQRPGSPLRSGPHRGTHRSGRTPPAPSAPAPRRLDRSLPSGSR